MSPGESEVDEFIFTGSLADDEWTAPSAAAGWRIADVVAHIGATALSFYTPAGLRTIFAASLEQVNEVPVDGETGAVPM
ncbi:maleylpyruvate isomerase N-terminal domain-containing protein [Streptomyces coeruleorubidus]|uniref:maleylpyruvate isomerase N-terminal domain-containing protein n=1 Tax=Streptomyces coeruleorubidus TaxID=116188 RepID=UPI0033BAF6D3